MLPATLIKDAAYEACRAYVLTPPFKAGQFRLALEEERDLHVEVQQRLMPDGTFGLCVAESTAQFVIFYHSLLRSVLQREATIWHELGHIFLDHVTPRRNRFRLKAAYDPGLAFTIFHDTAEDYEAELFARTMLRYALGHNARGYDLSVAARQRDPERASQLKRFFDELALR